MIKISNEKIRKLWLKSCGLQNKVYKEFDLLQIIKDLGFVQIDTIQNVTRAHHHILYSRDRRYKEHMIDELLQKGEIFEHFTHDASVLPMEFYPLWKIQFEYLKQKIDKSKYYKNILDEKGMKDIVNRFKNEGSLHIKDFEGDSSKKKTWTKSDYKSTLDYMWYAGVLATSHRINFRKYYNLRENIIPKKFIDKTVSRSQQIDWLCKNALDKLSIATPKEIKEFWGVLSTQEVNKWIEDYSDNLVQIQWENFEKKYIKSFASRDIESKLNDLDSFDSSIKIINPFDPAIRDRKRLKNIFGFDYKIEIFLPKAKRVWGYYVYPLLQADRFIGRIDLKADRKAKSLDVVNLWLEDDIRWDEDKQNELTKELNLFSSFVGIEKINWKYSIKT